MVLGSSISWNIRSFFRVIFVCFLSWGSYFLKYKKLFRSSVSWNIRKAFFWENIRNFLIIDPESSIFLKYKKIRINFLYFFELWIKNCVRWLHILLLILAKHRKVWNYVRTFCFKLVNFYTINIQKAIASIVM